MSVLEMTYVSYFLIILSAVFGTAALIMYFVFDIRRCIQIVRSGRIPMSVSHNCPEAADLEREEMTERLARSETTRLLETEATVPLETMELVQDITLVY